MFFLPYLGIGCVCGGGGGAPDRLAHNLLIQFFTLYSSRIEVSETLFFGILAILNDHPSYVKCV